MNPEDVPYRAHFPNLEVPTDDSKQVTRDEQEFSTLETSYLDLKSQIDGLDKWSAFNVDNDSDGKIKEQIRVNRRVFEILSPIAESMRDALARVNDKYKEK